MIADLIKALTIFQKYLESDASPTHCEHDYLMVMVHSKEEVSKEDQAELDKLGFRFDRNLECWLSSRFGSA